MTLVRAIQQLRSNMRAVRTKTGKSFVAQLSEIWRLRRGPGRLGVSEYFDLGVFDDASLANGRKEDFLGWRVSRDLDKKLNNDTWRALANDKLLTYHCLSARDIPVPETFALFASLDRALPGCRHFSESGPFLDFLTNEVAYPVFVKPVVGTYGRSAFGLRGYDPQREAFGLLNGNFLPKHELERILTFQPYHGIVVQELLRPHSVLERAAGSSISCARVVVLLDGGSVEPFCAFWKISVGKNMTDNFAHGRLGNLLGWVDVHNGKIVRVTAGMGLSCKEVATHPTTGRKLVGLALPDWERAVGICTSGAPVFAGLHLQHWDIAFTKRGPVVVEINTKADLSIPQMVARHGLLTETLRGALERKLRTDQEEGRQVRRRDELEVEIPSER